MQGSKYMFITVIFLRYFEPCSMYQAFPSIWSHFEAKRLHLPKVWKYWLLTMFFGLAGGFPLFLWAREKHLHKAE